MRESATKFNLRLANGDIAMSIVEQKANKFGEALVRVSHPTQQQLKTYQPVVLNPTKIRVVLDLNSIDFDKIGRAHV